LAKGYRLRIKMSHTLTDAQLSQLKQTHRALADLIASIELDKPRPDNAPTAVLSEPSWVAEYRRAWKFLDAVERAGGKLLLEEISIIARKNGYDSRGVNG